MKTASRSTSRDSVLARLMEDYLASCATGQPLSANELAARYPELAEQVSDCLASLDFIRRAAVGSSASVGNALLGVPPTDALGGVPTSESRLPTPDSPSAAGQLGDFRILREVGRGGMGVVYEAEQISLARRVALKVLPFASVLDPKQLARFKNEALAAASLDHPHIVDVLGVGCDRGTHFYAMRFIDGCTLADVIDELRTADKAPTSGRGDGREDVGPTDPAECDIHPLLDSTLTTGQGFEGQSTTPRAILTTLGITDTSRRTADHYRKIAALIADAADALHHAHEQGVIHRDIKPSNLMLDNRSKLWITDFGLAHIESNASLTMTGDLMGTLRYMSPEQATGSRLGIDHRTDIYSLGVTLYELLTLQPVFANENRADLLRQIANDDPITPRKHDKSIPVDLETIVLKSQSKQAADRYATAAELAADLRRFLAHEPLRAKRLGYAARLRRFALRHRYLVVAAAAGCLIASLVSSGFVWQGWMQAVVQRNSAQVAQKRAEDNHTLLLDFVAPWLGRMGRSDPAMTPEFAVLREAMLKDGINLYRRIADSRSEDPLVLMQSAEAFGHLASLHHLLGDREEAVTCNEESLAINLRLASKYPENAAMAYQLARSEDGVALYHWEIGEFDQSRLLFLRSIASFRGAYKLDPDDERGVNAYAWSLVAYPDPALHDPPTALALAQRAIELGPHRGHTLNTLGLAQLRNGLWDDAVQSLEAALRLSTNPEELDFIFLSIAEARRGNVAKAQRYCDEGARIVGEKYPEHAQCNRFLEEARIAIAVEE